MAATSSRGSSTAETELRVPRNWKDRQVQISPERTRVWTETKGRTNVQRKVAVVYSLCRNGLLEQPHFMEVPVSSHDGLYLRDVINRLNQLRGKGMANLYSWSSKRSYKNGFVWHDLAENDFIYPTQGREYVLKGSEIIEFESPNAELQHREPFTAIKQLHDVQKSSEDSGFSAITRQRNQSWSSVDLNEYKVYKTESTSESTRRLAANASTQTVDKRRRRKPIKEEEIQELAVEKNQTELTREEISPPQSDSSTETLGSLMKADGRLILCTGEEATVINRTTASYPSGRMKASAVLMQLISCGSMSFRDCGPKDEDSSLVEQCNASLAAGEAGTSTREMQSFTGAKLEDKEYFSGSLIETKKRELLPQLRRSNSYNADGGSQLQFKEKEKEKEKVK